MKSWHEVMLFIQKHELPYRVERFNMSLRGVLVSTSASNNGLAVAYTVKDADSILRVNR